MSQTQEKTDDRQAGPGGLMMAGLMLNDPAGAG